jgi:quinol monooxygenase YgiN
VIEFSVIIFSQPNQQEALLKLLTPLVEASRKEKGAIMYDLHSSEEGVFVITEKWQSQATLDAHEATTHFIVFQEKASALIEKVLRLPLVSI